MLHRARRLVLAAMLGTVMVGCEPLPQQRLAPPLAAAPASAVDAVERLWRYTGDESGAYVTDDRLDHAPSLYATSWALEIARRTGLATPNLSRADAGGWLQRALNDNAASAQPQLNDAWLAARALIQLGAAVAKEPVESILENLRVGDLYRFNRDQSASWAATWIASELADAAQVPVAAGVRKVVTGSKLIEIGTKSSPQDVLASVLPMWLLADKWLSTSDRADARGLLEPILRTTFAANVNRETLGGVNLGVLVDVIKVSQANDIPLGSVDASIADALTTPSGMLSLFANQRVDDPQVTAHAVELGFRPGPRLSEWLARSGPRGWDPPGMNNVDIETTWFALRVLALERRVPPVDPLRNQIRAWLEQLRKKGIKADALSAFFTVSLAQAYGIPVAPEVSGQVVAGFGDASVPAAQLRWLLRLAALLEIDIRSLRGHISTRLNSLPDDMRKAEVLEIAADLLATPSLATRARAIAESLRFGDGFRTRADISSPDLRATCVAHLALRVALDSPLRGFTTAAGSWLWPLSAGSGNVLNAQSLYLGLVLERGQFDTPLVCYD